MVQVEAIEPPVVPSASLWMPPPEVRIKYRTPHLQERSPLPGPLLWPAHAGHPLEIRTIGGIAGIFRQSAFLRKGTPNFRDSAKTNTIISSSKLRRHITGRSSLVACYDYSMWSSRTVIEGRVQGGLPTLGLLS